MMATMMPPTTKAVSVDFTDGCYIRGSNRVQGLAFTNFENSYSDTNVRRVSSDSIRNFLRPDAPIAIARIRKGGLDHPLQLRFIGITRLLYRLADNGVSLQKQFTSNPRRFLPSVMAYLAECRVSLSMARRSNHIVATKQDQHEAKQSRGLSLRRNRRPSRADFQGTAWRDCS